MVPGKGAAETISLFFPGVADGLAGDIILPGNIEKRWENRKPGELAIPCELGNKKSSYGIFLIQLPEINKGDRRIGGPQIYADYKFFILKIQAVLLFILPTLLSSVLILKTLHSVRLALLHFLPV